MEWYKWTAEAAVPPDLGGLADIPKIITDLGWVGVAILVTFMFATNRWYSSKQVERMLDTEREITQVWKQNAEELKPMLEELVQILQPLGQSDAAILKAVEGLQAAQELDRRFRKLEQRGD